MGLKKKLIDTVRLTSEQFEILRKVAQDVFFFAQFIKVLHPIRGKVPFDLYPFQKVTLWQFLKHRFNIVLKFRQAGITELISMYCLWFAMYHPHKNVVILSIKDRVAKRILRRIKFMYRELPDYLKTRIVNGRGEDSFGTATEIEFANGSIITSIPTTEDAGRSEAVSLFVIDEAAIIRWADRIWAALFPTLSTGGRSILNSTPYGVGNLFHRLWVNACAGEVFNPIRLHWQMHPERDWKWYFEQKQVLGERKTAQEIDGDFLASGNTVFDLSDIRAIEDSLNDIQYVKVLRDGQLKIFKKPDPKERYFIGADVATGRANDYSAFSIMSRDGEEVAAYKGKIPVDHYADMLAKWGRTYNNAVVAPESNDIGLAVAMDLQKRGYKNLYYSRTMLRKKGEARPKQEEIPGWYTTKKNRPIIIADLEEDIRNDTIDLKDAFFCQEAYTFIYDARNRPVAMNKDKSEGGDVLDEQVYTDDSIFAKAIANFIRKQRFNSKPHLVK